MVNEVPVAEIILSAGLFMMLWYQRKVFTDILAQCKENREATAKLTIDMVKLKTEHEFYCRKNGV